MWHGVPFACQRCPIIGALRMCWLLPGSFDCFCCPHTSVHRPSIACLAVFLCGPGALFLHALSGPSTICPFPPHGWSAPDGLPLLLRKQPIWAAGDSPPSPLREHHQRPKSDGNNTDGCSGKGVGLAGGGGGHGCRPMPLPRIIHRKSSVKKFKSGFGTGVGVREGNPAQIQRQLPKSPAQRQQPMAAIPQQSAAGKPQH